MDSERMMADGDCPEDEMDCRCARSDSVVPERTMSWKCAPNDGSFWLGEAADSGEVADDGGGWWVWIDGSFSLGNVLDGESLRLRRCGEIADESVRWSPFVKASGEV